MPIPTPTTPAPGLGIPLDGGGTFWLADRAQQSVTDWGLDRLQVGYGQSVESMRAWGLFVSKGIKDPEPDLFGEPGVFLIRPDATVYMAAVNSMPAARPRIADILGAATFFTQNDYPARGEA